VAELDFKSGDPGDRTKSLKIDIDQFDLKVGDTYSIVADHEFVSINMKPWDVGKIDRGAWTFTVSEPSSGAASVKASDAGALNSALSDSGVDGPDAFDASTISIAERAVLDLAAITKKDALTLAGARADAPPADDKMNEIRDLAYNLSVRVEDGLGPIVRGNLSGPSEQASELPLGADALGTDAAAIICKYVRRSAESDSDFFVL
jgi:hypothetical protein